MDADLMTGSKALAISEIRYLRLFETAKDGILILDAETGMITDVNPFLINLLGYSREEFIEKAIWEIGFFKDIIANQDNFIELQQMEYIRYDDLPLETADGRKINVEFVSNVYMENHHRVIQCNIRNITERKMVEDKIHKLNETLEQQVVERTNQLEAANKELAIHMDEIEQFTYIASHDLQEPLRTLTTYTQLIKEEYAGKLEGDGNKYVDFIFNSAGRMRDLVKGLVEYSILGKESVMTMVECQKIVSEVLSDLEDSIRESKATITVQELPSLTGYETELRLLFQNLINNAIKFQKKDMLPEINISAETVGNDWLFKIKDNGIGIEGKNRDKIFIIFKRMHNRCDFKGTGIGLAHCKKIVELHGGRISVDSTPGEGSTFIFTIPQN